MNKINQIHSSFTYNGDNYVRIKELTTNGRIIWGLAGTFKSIVNKETHVELETAYQEELKSLINDNNL